MTPPCLLTPENDHRCLESPGVMPSFRNLRAHPCHYFLLSSDIMVMMFGIWMYSSKLWCDNSDTLRTRFTKYGRCLWGFIDGIFLDYDNFWLADKWEWKTIVCNFWSAWIRYIWSTALLHGFADPSDRKHSLWFTNDVSQRRECVCWGPWEWFCKYNSTITYKYENNCPTHLY